MGDVWPEDEKIIEQMIITFKDHKIIIMPQTIYYDDLEKVMDSFERLVMYLRIVEN